MRASTSRRILFWIVGALGVAAVIALVSGAADAREQVGGFVFLALVVGGLSWLGSRYRVLPRRGSFSDQAERAGLRARVGDPLGLLDSSFSLFHRAVSVRDLENTATGFRGGEHVIVADYWDSPSSDAQRDDYRRSTCVLTTAPSWWPDLSALPESVAARLRSTFAMPDVEMELEAFNRRFEVRSDDARFAHALLDARLMAWLLEQPPSIGFEIADGRLMVIRPRETASLDDVQRALELSDALRERIPHVVRGEPI